ncbi:hypothetical protein JXA63_05795 [Candidatus Woesebacteria bacterium]|nr:hypothetical protein [Candidatus Woesebacteria bacterium]
MLRKVAYVAVPLFIAFFVLLTSIFKSAAVVYDFSDEAAHFPTDGIVLGDNDINIEYPLVYPGKILPDHFLWPVKAMRDRAWLFLTTNDSREAELLLLLADKRLASAKVLFDEGKADLGYTVLTKAEKYLEEASQKEMQNRKEGIDTSMCLERLARASLKHLQVIKEVSLNAPEDAQPQLKSLEKMPHEVYEDTLHALNEKGMQCPQNPFVK